jgi:hypothetical protein
MYLIDKIKISIMEKLMTKQDYAKQVRQINSTDGYFNRFYELSGECRTHQEAWLKLEEERDTFGLDEKYKTYDSFRKAKSLYMVIRFV